MCIGSWWVGPTGKSFRLVSFVLACARSGCLVEFDLKRWLRQFLGPPSPFPPSSRQASHVFFSGIALFLFM